MARDNFKITARFAAKDEASTKIKGLRGAFSSLTGFIKDRLVITLGDLAHIFGAVAGAIGQSIDAAKRQEDAIRNLEASLSKYGEAGAEAAKGAQEFASGLQAVSRFGDEAIIEAQALLATFGATPETLNNATTATVELAAAFGKTLPEAARLVGRTFGGFAGELGEVIPELKDLSAEALKAGGAVELLSEKFAGRAVADASTYSGAVAQLGNAWRGVLETLGAAFTENELVRTSLVNLKNTISSASFKDNLRAIGEGFAELTAAVARSVEVLNKAIGVYRRFVDAIDVGLGRALKDQEDATRAWVEQLRFVEESLEADRKAAEDAAQAARAKAEADRKAADEARKRAAEELELANATEKTGEATLASLTYYDQAADVVAEYGRAASTAAVEIREFTSAQVAANEATGSSSGVGPGGIASSGAILPGLSVADLLQLDADPRNTIPIVRRGAFRVNGDGTVTVLSSPNVRNVPPGGITI